MGKGYLISGSLEKLQGQQWIGEFNDIITDTNRNIVSAVTIFWIGGGSTTATSYHESAVGNGVLNIQLDGTFNAPLYKVIYDTNGGNADGPTDDTGLSNGPHTLNTSTVPTKDADAGYTYSFAGWGATPTATEAERITSVTIAGANVTVYAIWNATPITVTEPQTYKVIYDTNGGNADGPDNDEGLSNGTHELNTSKEPTKDADDEFTYSFAGWGATPTATAAERIYSVTIEGADVTVYAIWNKTQITNNETQLYKIIYNTNGGNADGPDNDEGLSNGTHELNTSKEPTKDADDEFTYSFAGWGATPTATAAERIYSVTIEGADVTVYAIWDKTQITNDNDDEGGGNDDNPGTEYPPYVPPVTPEEETGVAGETEKEDEPEEEPAPTPEAEEESQVAGESEVLPQTGGISAATLAGIAGLILLGSGLVMFFNNRKKREE